MTSNRCSKYASSRPRSWRPFVTIVIILSLILATNESARADEQDEGSMMTPLPTPRTDSDTSVEEALRARRSIRDFTGDAIRIDEIAQLLWAAQGITDEEGKRTSPSAGATYPLVVYLAAGNVDGVDAGIYAYRPDSHTLELVAEGDVRRDLTRAALSQSVVSKGAAVIVIAAVYDRTTRKYGSRGRRYVHMEAGHAAENVYLQAAALGLGTVVVGAFDDDNVQRVMRLNRNEKPLYLMPIGKPLRL